MPEEKPGLLALSVTADCNLRCSYCYACGGEEKTMMSWPIAKRAIDVMAECFPAFKVQFTGGEPILNLDLIERAVNYLDDLGLSSPCQIQTNATLVTADVAGRLKGLKLGIGVSLDGLASVNDALRPFFDGHGSTAAAIRGILALRDEGILVGATTVLTRANAGALNGLVDLFSYLGNIDGVAIDFVRPVGRASSFIQPNPAQAAEGIEAAICRAEHLYSIGARGIKFRELERMKSTIDLRKKRQHHCYFDSCRSLVVLADGLSYVCPSLLRPEMMLGRVEERHFADGLRDRMVRACSLVTRPRECVACPDLWLCGGPCLAHYLAGRNLSIECSVKRVFMRHARNVVNDT
jgi:uncharacterized protein